MADVEYDEWAVGQEEVGADLYARGYPMSYCENSNQEWGWLMARESGEGIPAQ